MREEGKTHHSAIMMAWFAVLHHPSALLLQNGLLLIRLFLLGRHGPLRQHINLPNDTVVSPGLTHPSTHHVVPEVLGTLGWAAMSGGQGLQLAGAAHGYCSRAGRRALVLIRRVLLLWVGLLRVLLLRRWRVLLPGRLGAMGRELARALMVHGRPRWKGLVRPDLCGDGLSGGLWLTWSHRLGWLMGTVVLG